MNKEHLTYHENGKIHIRCSYVDDKLHGNYEEYNDKGYLVLKCCYKAGKLNGVKKEYHNGELCSRTLYKDGKRSIGNMTFIGNDNTKIEENEYYQSIEELKEQYKILTSWKENIDLYTKSLLSVFPKNMDSKMATTRALKLLQEILDDDVFIDSEEELLNHDKRDSEERKRYRAEAEKAEIEQKTKEKEILKNFIKNYTENSKIISSFNENLSLEKLIGKLEKSYPNHIELTTIKLLLTTSDSIEREMTIKNCLKHLLMENINDEDIIRYLEMSIPKVEEKNSDMVFVKEVNNFPLISNDKVLYTSISNLFVSKYLVTQNEWEKYMGYNPSHFKGNGQLPAESMTWIEALEFCNKMSEFYGLQPVYKIKNNRINKIIYKCGVEVEADEADFSKTEGYRLPTEAEWQWFARGGEESIKNATFDTEYAGSNDLDEVAWYEDNSDYKTHEVGCKKANALGLFDCTGNVSEWCYGTKEDDDISDEDIFSSKKEDIGYKILKGGAYQKYDKLCKINHTSSSYSKGAFNGLRIVRTADR